MSQKGIRELAQEYSLPLIGGVFAALWIANVYPEWYHHFVHAPIVAGTFLGHELNAHFLINDVFMVFFFGIAAKEITDAVLPGGSLNPPAKAVNPLLGTLGGVLGPVGVFLLLTHLVHGGTPDFAAVARGWGVPTATDIALAWLAARMVFGARHPAVNFLLLLAVADDAIGLAIIAIFYPDPHHPVALAQLLWTAGGMATALGLRLAGVRSWLPYVAVGGGMAWYGLIAAHLHPALALVFIVPFLPAQRPLAGLMEEQEDRATAGTGPAGLKPELFTEQADRAGAPVLPAHLAEVDTPLEQFEHTFKAFVDFGLFFFAFANAGVELTGIGPLTWIILASLIVGKTGGIFLLSSAARRLGFPLPTGMDTRTLAVAGLVAGLGLTVALFVAGVAYPDPLLQGEAKMGALFSGVVFLLALIAGRVARVERIKN